MEKQTIGCHCCHSRQLLRLSVLSERELTFLLVINTNLPTILHFFGDTAFQIPKIAIFGYPLAFKPPDGGVSLKRSP